MRRLAGLVLALGLVAPAWAANITVFAAASLQESLEAAARAFESSGGPRVVASYAGSNALARQIQNGAPADVFISADADWVDFLEQRGLLREGSRRNLVANDLVLVAPAASPVRLKLAPGAGIAGALGGKRIALANPDAVPAGRYAKIAFAKLGLWDAIAGHVASADNVRAALALVARGEAPLGVVYRTDAIAEKSVRIVDVFPADSHPPIVYPMVLTKRASAPADALAAWLATPPARAIFERFGFRTP